MVEVIITIEKDLKLAIKGSYIPQEEANGLSDYFEIESIESLDKDVFDLLEWASANRDNYLEIIEEKAREKYLE